MTAYRHSTKYLLAISVMTVSWFLIGCGATQPVRVIPKQSTSITASLGGPVVPGSSPTVVIPYLTGGVMHGATDDLTLHGNLHLLMSAFGVIGIDVGASTRLLRGEAWMPEITAGLRAHGFVQLSDQPKPRLYPSLSANASWNIRDQDLVYVGSHLTGQFAPNEVFVSPFIGYSYAVNQSLSLQCEFIWQASNHDTRRGLFEGVSSINGQGSFGIFLAGALSL